MSHRTKSRENHWRGVLKEQSTSDLTVAAFCRQKAISHPSYYAWRRKFLEQKESRGKQIRSTKSARATHNTRSGAQLLPVRIEGTTPTSTLRIHLPQQGIFVDVPHGTDCETVKGVLQALRELTSC